MLNHKRTHIAIK